MNGLQLINGIQSSETNNVSKSVISNSAPITIPQKNSEYNYYLNNFDQNRLINSPLNNLHTPFSNGNSPFNSDSGLNPSNSLNSNYNNDIPNKKFSSTDTINRIPPSAVNIGTSLSEYSKVASQTKKLQ